MGPVPPHVSPRSYKAANANEAQWRSTFNQESQWTDKHDDAGYLSHRRRGFSTSIHESYRSVSHCTCNVPPLPEILNYILRVQRDLHRLRSELESKMPKRPSTLNIDHSRLLIGSPEEGYMVRIDHWLFPLACAIWRFSAIDTNNLAKCPGYDAKDWPSLGRACSCCSAPPR